MTPENQSTQPIDVPCACRAHALGAGPRAAPCAGCAISFGNLLAVHDAFGAALGAALPALVVEHNHGTPKCRISSDDTHAHLF